MLQLRLQLQYTTSSSCGQVTTATIATIHYTTPHYTTPHYTTLHHITLHYTTLPYTTLHYPHLHYTTLHLQLQPQLQLRYFTLHYTTLHSTILHYITPDPLHLQFDCKCTTLITLHPNYSSTTLQLQLHCTTLNPAGVGEVTTVTIATTPTNTNPTTFRSISGFALPFVIHNNQPLL